MKKIILFLTLAALPILGICQAPIAEIWTKPAIFKADEPVTIFFDVSGSALADQSDPIYLWSWFPSEPDAGNWANSSEFARLTQVSGNVWKITMTPTTYYKKPASEIVAIYGLLKNKDGSKVTDAFAPDKGNAITLYDFTAIKGNAVIDFYPKRIPGDRPFSIVLNTKNTWSDCSTAPTQGALSTAPNVHMHSGLNDWAVIVENNPANQAKTQLTHLGDGIYRMDMIPWEYYGKEVQIERINAVFASADWSKLGFDKACADFLLESAGAGAPIVPSIKYFPQKLTAKDMFSIIVVNNAANISSLSYTITGGGATLEGNFEGSRPKYNTSIDLAGTFKNIPGLNKLHIVVKANTGLVLYETDYSLVVATK